MSRCDSVWLRRSANAMMDNSRRVPQLSPAVRTDFDTITAEHRDIAYACVTGDGDLAVQHHTHHLWRTIDAFDEWACTQHPAP